MPGNRALQRTQKIGENNKSRVTSRNRPLHGRLFQLLLLIAKLGIHPAKASIRRGGWPRIELICGSLSVMTSDEKFAVAAHLYVLLRRKSGRVIDTMWMAQNSDYACEILRIARQQADEDIARLADRFEALMPVASKNNRIEPESPASAQRKYVDSLR
jgi:hypothetical protein